MKRVYTDDNAEYQALRGGTGLIDYQGIGRYAVGGSQAAAFLNHVATRTVDFLLEGQVSNALLLRPDGTVLAEALLHCRGDDYLVEVWPAQAAEAGEHLRATAAERDDVTVTDLGGNARVFGIEGPESFRVVAKFLPFPVASMAYSSFATVAFDDAQLLISRTGVTAEYGFKLHVPADQAERLREELIGAGAREVGLDALNVCRMESRFVNLEDEAAGTRVRPSDIGLQWMVDMNGEFVGAEALREPDAAPARRPVCWQADAGARQVPPAAAPVVVADQQVGEVAHAVWSPALERVIGTARVADEVAASGLEYAVDDASVRSVSAPFLVATSFSVTME